MYFMNSKQNKTQQSNAFPSDSLPIDQFRVVSNIVPAAAASNAAAVQSEGKPSTNIPETLEADTIYISDSEQ